MAATGISISRGATNSSMDEYELKKLIVEKSGEIFLLVDSTKFDTISLMTYSSLENIDYILTNETPPKKYQDFFKKNKINNRSAMATGTLYLKVSVLYSLIIYKG